MLAIFALRNMPVAPFTFINVVAGVSHVRFRDFFVGTVAGMAPGIAAMCVMGESIWRLFADPSPGRMALLAGAVLLWIGVGVGLQRLVDRLRRSDG